MKNKEITDFPFLYDLNTRWKDMDSFGHVNNAVFLTYLEDARISFFKRWSLDGRKRSIIMVSVKMDYHQQVGHPSSLVVGQRISRIGKTSFDIQAAIFVKDYPNLAASAVITCVCFDYEQNKSVSVYSEIKSDFQQDKAG